MKTRNVLLLSAFSLFFYANSFSASNESTHYLKITPEVQTFINEMATRHHFKRDVLKKELSKAEDIDEVIQRMNQPFESQPWDYYRDYFVTPKRIQLGIVYWHLHKGVLDKIEKRYGVPASVIVAITGVETLYGAKTGNYQELGALATLAFHYKAREPFFKNELTQYLILTRAQKLNALELMGSYAGALGIPQFMPSSYINYGVDYSENRCIDLLHNNADAFASVANYLKTEGWQRGEPVATEAVIQGDFDVSLIDERAYATKPLSELEKNNIRPKEKMGSKIKATLISLNGRDKKTYWITFRNFRSIMNYNPSTNYAMAVYQLSRELDKAYKKQYGNS